MATKEKKTDLPAQAGAPAKIAMRAIIKPRTTEKAAIHQASKNVYVFNVEKAATKKSIAHDLKTAYKITPIKIRMAAVPAKKVFYRGMWGVKGGGKKAYVYLKKGDSITI